MRPLRRRLIVGLQTAFVLVVVWLAWRTIDETAGTVDWSSVSLQLSWGWIAVASVLVFGTYLMLIEVWVRHLRAWDAIVRFPAAARMWFIANLGKYIPGKIWGLATMAFMAQQRGVSTIAVLGSTVTGMVIGMVAGLAVVLATGAPVIGAVLARGEGASPLSAGVALGVGVVGLLVTPTLIPAAMRLVARLSQREIPIPRLSSTLVWGIAAATALSWVAYGIAFAMFTRGILGSAAGGLMSYIAVYTASYLLGLVSLIPGGMVVREGGLVLGLTTLGLATPQDAVVLAVTSRIWLTILEILPGIVVLAVGPRAPVSEREAPVRP